MIKDFSSVVESYINKFESQLFTALPATIESFDSDKQTATVRPSVVEAYTDGDTSYFAKLHGVPVIFPSAGGGALTFPVKPEDEVLLVFSARNFDRWWETGEAPSLSTTQGFHEYNDAVAIVGLTSRGNSTKANTEDVELKFNGNVIRLVSDGTVEVETKDTISISNSKEELISILSETIEAISKITTNTMYGVTPINNKGDFSSLKSRLDTFKK